MSLPFTSLKQLNKKCKERTLKTNNIGSTLHGDGGYNPMLQPRPVGPIYIPKNSSAKINAEQPNVIPAQYKHMNEQIRFQDRHLKPDINPIERYVVERGGLDTFRVAPKNVDQLRSKNNPKTVYQGNVIPGQAVYKAPTANMDNLINKKAKYELAREVDLDVAQRYPIEAGPLEGILGVQETSRQDKEDNTYLGHAQFSGAGNVVQHDYSGVIFNPQQLPGQFSLNVKPASSAQNQLTNLPTAEQTQRGNLKNYNGNINLDSGNLNYLETPDPTQRNSTNVAIQGNVFQNNSEKIMLQQTPDVTSREQIQRANFGSINVPMDDLYLANMQTPDPTQRGNQSNFTGQIQYNNAAAIDNIQAPEVTGRQTLEDQQFQGIYSGQTAYYLDNMQQPDSTMRQSTQYQNMGNLDGMEKSLQIAQTPDATQRGNYNNYDGIIFGEKQSLDIKPNVDITSRQQLERNLYSGEIHGNSQNLFLMQKPDSTNRQQTSQSYLGELSGAPKAELFNMQTPEATQRQQTSTEYVGDISLNQGMLTNFQKPKVTGRETIAKNNNDGFISEVSGVGSKINLMEAEITGRQTIENNQDYGHINSENNNGYQVTSQNAKITQRQTTQTEQVGNANYKLDGAYEVTNAEAPITGRQTLENKEGGYAYAKKEAGYAVNKYETCPTRREEISTEYSGNPAGKNKNKSYQDAYQMEVRNSKIQTQNNKHINLGLQPKIQFVKGTNTRKNRKDNTNQRKPLPAFIQRRN